MGLYQPTVITPSQLNGTGVIDATQDMTVTWQINGTQPMVSWQFFILENTPESTEVYRSEVRAKYYHIPGSERVYEMPIYGKDERGNPVPFQDTITAADLANAGIVNGYQYGYKLRIDQFYVDSTDFVFKRLVNISPVFFLTSKRPTFTIPNGYLYQGRCAYFGGLISDEQPGNPLISYRWKLAKQDSEHEILKDTGDIYASRAPFVFYGLMKNHTNYSIQLTGTFENGITAQTDWEDFTVAWPETPLEGVHLEVYYVRDNPAFFLRISADEGYEVPQPQKGWDIYRINTQTNAVEKAGLIPPGQTEMYDFGACNNTEYIYKAYYAATNYEGYTLTSERPMKMRYYWNWAIIETTPANTEYMKFPVAGAYEEEIQYITIYNTLYHVKRVHQFQANVDSGSISNENTPYVENNFTPYPTVQKVGRKGLSGKLRAWVGGVKDTQFRDSVKMVDDLMDLSTRDTVKFLRDRKGNLRMIEISDAIVKETQDKYAEQPVQIEIPWVEVGDAKDCQIVSLLTDGLMARGDDIIDTTTAISVDQDGYVTWTMDPDGYIGSEIQMNDGGQLEQVYDNSMEYVPADLEIDNEGKLKVETVIKADE